MSEQIKTSYANETQVENHKTIGQEKISHALTIGIDVDDVLGKCVKAILEYHNEKYNTNFKDEDVTDFALCKLWGGTEEDTINKIIEFYKTEHFEQMEPYEDAIKGIRKLVENHTVIAITARSEDTRDTTQGWLLKYFPNSFSNVFLTNSSIGGKSKINKSQICIAEGVDIMVDDSMHNAKDCGERGIKVLLIDRPWNQGELPRNVERVADWDEIIEKINILEKKS